MKSQLGCLEAKDSFLVGRSADKKRLGPSDLQFSDESAKILPYSIAAYRSDTSDTQADSGLDGGTPEATPRTTEGDAVSPGGATPPLLMQLRMSLPHVTSGEEVLARWADDGWYYRGELSEKV